MKYRPEVMKGFLLVAAIFFTGGGEFFAAELFRTALTNEELLWTHQSSRIAPVRGNLVVWRHMQPDGSCGRQIASRLPRGLIYACAIRMIAEVTRDDGGLDISAREMLKRWTSED